MPNRLTWTQMQKAVQVALDATAAAMRGERTYTRGKHVFDLTKGGQLLRKMNPEKRSYVSSAMMMTEAAIDTGLTRDVYVSLGEPIDKDQPFAAWAVRVYHKPFVDWIWGGCVLMAIGGVLAISDRRYRRRAILNSSPQREMGHEES